MAHHHHHGEHDHHHADEATSSQRRLVVAIGLNLGFVSFEAGYGLVVGSLALVADAGHNLSDVMSLGLALGAAVMAQRAPSAHRTYGLRRATILASLVSALLLLVAMGGIAWAAIGRLGQPVQADGVAMMIVAGAGVLINAATALVLARGRHDDANLRAAFQHMVADAALSLGVVVGGAGVLLLGLQWMDPAISLVIVAAIVWGTWDLLRESVDLAVDAVPRGVDPLAVSAWLESLPGVARIHDLHIWGMSTTECAITAHLVMPEGGSDAFLHEVARDLRQRFRISHATIQVEHGREPACAQMCGPGAVQIGGHGDPS